VKERAIVSEQEKRYLEVMKLTLHQDESFIFESKEWVEAFRKPVAKEFLRPLWKFVYKLVCKDLVLRKEKDKIPVGEPRGILYRQFNSGLLLISPFGIEGAKSDEALRQEYQMLFSCEEEVSEQELRKNSIRAYPESIAWEEDTWVNVQKGDKDANLSLSPEESELLHSILTPGQNQRKYPLFINGRPGSGKTTILQYLFSDLLDFYLNSPDRLPEPPLYLTYSTSLLERAKKTVSNILKCDYKRLVERTNPDIEGKDGRDAFNRSFYSFRGLLLSQLEPTARSRFAANRYVDFPKFKKDWVRHVSQNSQIPQELRKSPELAWHAIRTFIKGRRSSDGFEEDFHPESYAELPKRQKSIDEALYAEIYSRIWNGWYRKKCLDDNMWDDQDLALEVLRLEDGISKYPAIFCDEAQDFTANELAVILKLSLYSARTVPHYQLSSIPFVFAGDPFQTLNPTGFDWNALSDEFRQNILRELDPIGRHKLQINFQELSYNYRSAEPIVRLCNLVQLIRGVLFDIGGLRPGLDHHSGQG
jgi:hypothetical protein